MQKRASWLTTVLLGVMVGAMALPATAQAPALKTLELPPVTPGETAWLHFFWEGDKKATIHDFRMTIQPPNGYSVTYPSLRSYTSFYNGSTLDAGEVDYAAVRLTVPITERTSHHVDVNVSYKANGKTYTLKRKTLLKVRVNKGDDFAVYTTAVGPLNVDSNTWIHVDFQGLAPRLDSFKMTVTDAQGMGFTYPGGRTYSGLYRDSTLSAGEVDYSALKLDTTGLADGAYTLALEVSYIEAVSTEARRQPVQVLVQVGAAFGGATAGAPILGGSAVDAFTADRQRLDRTGTRATFTLNAGEAHAGRSFIVLGSITGTVPGTPVASLTLPLNVDGYSWLTLQNPGLVFSNSQGTLDWTGRATATFTLPAGLLTPLDRLTLFHAYLVFDSGQPVMASEWAPLTVVDE